MEGFELHLPSWRKWKYTKILLQICHENGMTYGAADNDLRDMGDVICCCGIDNLPGFENFWRYQASQAAQLAKQNGYVTITDMENSGTAKRALVYTMIESGYSTKLNLVIFKLLHNMQLISCGNKGELIHPSVFSV